MVTPCEVLLNCSLEIVQFTCAESSSSISSPETLFGRESRSCTAVVNSIKLLMDVTFGTDVTFHVELSDYGKQCYICLDCDIKVKIGTSRRPFSLCSDLGLKTSGNHLVKGLCRKIVARVQSVRDRCVLLVKE